MYLDEENDTQFKRVCKTEDVFEDRDPNHRPSESGMWIEERNGVSCWVLRVRGLGAILYRAFDSETFLGMSVFSEEMIKFEDGLDREFEQRKEK